MLDEKDSPVMITEEACNYLGISRPTYLKYLLAGKIKGVKVGKGWRVLKSELDRLLDEPREIKSSEIKFSEMPPQKTSRKFDSKMPKMILRRRAKKTRVRNCLKCGRTVILEEGFFLCESCRKSNSFLEDFGGMYQSQLSDAVRTFRLGPMSHI